MTGRECSHSHTRAAWITADGLLGIACRCGERIYVTIDTGGETDPERLALTEFAVTCDPCGASHWVTPVVTGEAGVA